MLEMSVVSVPVLVILNNVDNFNNWTTLPTVHQDPADGKVMLWKCNLIEILDILTAVSF